jgi:hypothetical protein
MRVINGIRILLMDRGGGLVVKREHVGLYGEIVVAVMSGFQSHVLHDFDTCQAVIPMATATQVRTISAQRHLHAHLTSTLRISVMIS